MRKTMPKKLHLAKETLRGLKDQQLRLLMGGVTGNFCVTTPRIRCTI